MEKGGNRYEYQHDWAVLYPFGTTDFAPHVAKLAEQDPDIVLMDAYIFPDMLAIMNEMKKQGLDYETGEIILLGNDVLMLQIFVDVAKQEGISMSSGYVWGWQEHNPAQDEGTLARVEKYVPIYNAKYGDTEVGNSSPFDRGRLRRRHMVPLRRAGLGRPHRQRQDHRGVAQPQDQRPARTGERVLHPA